MRKICVLIIVVCFVAACNNGNEGSASISVDSLRIADSTRLADSLHMIDTTNRLIDTAGNR